MMTGVGRHVTDVIKAMAARGHEIHLLHSIMRCDKSLLGELDPSPGFHRRVFDMRRQPHWSDLSVLFALAQYVRRFGPFDVIHGHSSKGGAYARLLSAILPGSCLYTPHAFVTMAPHLTRTQHAAYATIERLLSRLTDTVICTSHEEGRHAASLGIDAKRLSVVPNRTAWFDITAGLGLRERLGLPASAVVIGFVGRLDEQKAPRRLVEAAAEALTRGHDVHVVVIGAGPQRAELEALTHERGIAQHFLWLGDTPSRCWIAGFDILAMPSLYEGCSYVLLEALYAGVPVVCTPVGGVRDAGFVDGVHGFIIPFDDVLALADRLCHLVSHPDLRRTMGRNARATSRSFPLEKMIDQLEAAYRLACGAASASPSAASSGL
jgi:glycosyltransferase involved in cell wall biosynthesis